MTHRPAHSKPVFLDPTIDWAFKRIFGSLESHDILVGFLNDLLHTGQPVIRSLTIKDPYLPARLKELKETAVDVRAVLDDGSEKLIEMQLFPTSGFTQRLSYNASKVMAGQLKRGGNYLNVRPVTVIAITNFVIFPHREEWFSHFSQMERTSGELYPSGGIDIIFLELPKASEDHIPQNHPMREWLSFLISAKNWRSIPRDVRNPRVRQACKMARLDNLSHKESELMSRRQMYQWDQINMRTHALEEGRAEGKAEGKAEGEAIGAARGKADTLIRILTKRIGPLPKSLSAQIGRCDFLQLEKLEDQVLELPSVKSVREFVNSLIS